MREDRAMNWVLLFLLTICCGLILYGVFGPEYCWFTGPKLTVFLVVGSMFGRLATVEHKPYANYVVYGAAVCALLVGMHLLMPYFWAVRLYRLPLLAVYAITAGLAWLYMLGVLHKARYFGVSYHVFCYLPVVIFTGTLLPQRMSFGGELYSSSLLSLFYVVLGGLLIVKAIRSVNRWYFNAGLVLLGSVALGVCLTFLFEFPSKTYLTGVLIAVLVLNLLFTTLQKRGNK